MINNKLLKKQLAKFNLQHLSNDPSFIKFLSLIELTYNKHDEQLDCLNNTLNTSLNKMLKLNESILLSSENNFLSLIEGFPGIISWFDRDLNYLGANKNFYQFARLSKEQVIGKRLGTIREGETKSDLIRSIEDFAQHSNEHHAGIYKLTAQNEIYYLNSHFQKLKNNEIIVVISIDTTNEMKAKEELEQTRLLEFRNQTLSNLGEMASGVAHEINNPLTVINLAINQLLKVKDVKTNENISSKLSKISKMCNRIEKIVKSMKFISRNGDNDQFLQTSFQEIFSNVEEIISERLKDFEIELIFSGNKEVLLWCQPVLLSQVFLNLINNSIDALERFQVKHIYISIQELSDEVSIEFSDSGIGVPIEIENQIFKPFFTTKEVGKGTGLGLSICKTIIEKQNGTFYLQRYENKTSFKISLPHKRESDPIQLPL